ncbi:nucleoporin or nuclear pore complex subunit [Trichoderma breve]|uniref:Nucleoporin or nuclear pore complex subunit n=1 Tax=Trichoderma breve TaxID=2034170 RepID=A0A9W9E6S7_9HYPO|nr:nucleoporin or nuclear pore complex subunit [Trichoderma breve]KAJ4861138.1 nucleoporin or nuclear pore complex subunit [Trichoderma breve]
MSFGFNASANAMGGGAGGVNAGPDLETIQTEALGFLSIAGDAKVRLTSAWETLPTATSSLLSVASKRGLVAAAGPDQLIIATTESIRKAFENPKDGDSDIRGFEPQLKIPMPMRVSQLVFTADENYLVLSAESGGGLAVYQVQSLLQGSSNSAFELSTNGEALRSLAPNPTIPELCAIVTNNGNLHMANLQERKISNALKNQVSCISWSSKGKQLCAGLADGTIHQMTPEGEGKADIPNPPNVANCHVSSLTWLENNLWLSIHSTSDSPPSSIYHIITRQPPSSFTYQKLTDPVQPFGSDKVPHHSILRLRDFPPDLQDLLIVSSTASTDVGLLTRSKSALTTDLPAESITNVFTTTELLDDSKRPTLPMTDSADDSTPIGVALDLSSKDKIYKPIPSDEELEESPTPLPGFWILTHEGVLCSWWIIYTDSIKRAVPYPGLTAIQGDAGSVPAPAASSASPFSSNAGPSPFSSSSAAAPAFGSSAQLGQKASPWGTGAAAAAAPAFGQSGFASFANKSAQSPSSGGFASFSSQGGFASLAGNNSSNTGGSVFGSGGTLAGAGSAFGSTSTDTAFPSKPAGSVFGSQEKPSGGNDKAPAASGSSMFGSTFGSALNDAATKAPDSAVSAKDEDMDTASQGTSSFGAPSSTTPAASTTSTTSLFGGKTATPQSGSGLFGSGSTFGSASKPPVTSSGLFGSATKPAEDESKTPTPKVANPFATPLPPDTTSKSSYLIGESSDSSVTSTTSSSFGSTATSKPSNPFATGLSGTDKNAAAKDTGASKSSSFIKVSKPSDEPPTVVEDAPLPPDPVKSNFFSKPSNAAPPAAFGLPTSAPKTRPSVTSAPALPSDGEAESDLDEEASEGSGVDVARDLSPTAMGLGTPKGPFNGFAEPPRADRGRSQQLFGEVGRSTPTIAQPDAIPRSPSPVRGGAPNRALIPDITRSASAPGVAPQFSAPKKSQLVASATAGKDKTAADDAFIAQSRKLRERQQAEESRVLIDEEDEEVQRVLASEIEGTLELDEFIAHSNVAPPAQESIPAQVEAVYRDINSMIDTLGLNARSVMAFIKGHTDGGVPDGRSPDDLDHPDDWVLCEIGDLGEILEVELSGDLEDGRVQDLTEQLEACQELAKDMHRLRAKQEDLKRVIMARVDPNQAEAARSLPLSAEQQTQQNELRREYTNFSKLLAEAEEALTLLKTRIASLSSASGRGTTNVPTVEAVMKTITKMTSMVEKRSGDIDVLETQLRRMRLETPSREESPSFRTPQSRRSILLSPDATPARSMRQSLSSSVMSLGTPVKTSTPRKKASGYSRDEKGDLMDKKAKRQAILGRLKDNVQKKGVSVWNMEDIE